MSQSYISTCLSHGISQRTLNMDTTLRENPVSKDRDLMNMDTTISKKPMSIDRESVSIDTIVSENLVCIDKDSMNTNTGVRENLQSAASICVNMDGFNRENSLSAGRSCINADFPLREDLLSPGRSCVNVDFPLREDSLSPGRSCVNADFPLREDTLTAGRSCVNADFPLREDTLSPGRSCVNADFPLREDSLSQGRSCVNADFPLREDTLTAGRSCVNADFPLREDSLSPGRSCVNADFPLREDTLTAGRSCVNADFPLREDTLRQAREARCDQGIHEVEVSFNAESDLRQALIMCDKNPGHHNYTPVNEISLDKFPESVQDNDVLEFIKIKAKETVRITCDLTSHARPEGYTFHKYRGSSMLRCGSGRVMGVFKDKIQTDIKCPFGDCQEMQGPHTVYGFIKVHTAMHVVFDNTEAKRTFVDFFYDVPNDRSTVVTARGVEVVQSDIVGDYCVINCVTHDPGLCTTLDTIRQQWSSKWPYIEKHLYGKNVSVAISHPHGCSKQFSIGSFIRREFEKVGEDQYWYRYTYKATTCPGCSGAPVWVSGGEGLPSSYAPHSGHEGNAINRSTVWFFWKNPQDNK